MENKNNDKTPIMIVDDDSQALSLLASLLCHDGYENVIPFEDSRRALDYFNTQEVHAVVLDLSMPRLHGMYLLELFTKNKPHVPVIIVTAENQIDSAIECIKAGAVDYLTKPISINRFMTSISRALELRSLNDGLSFLQDPEQAVGLPSAIASRHSIITHNKNMLSLMQYVEVISNSHQAVLINGETGVGKELVAKAIHTMSKRKGEFVSINISGLDDLMFSDTLFGHKKGAYTGANQDRDGLIKKAANGTIFLDEIGDLNELSQVKLLRLLQENEYYPLGSDNPLQSNARLVVASNRSLRHLVNEGKFRKDFYYRLCTHQVTIPPLRDRLDDIPLLLDHFIDETAKIFGKKRPTYRKELVDLLCSYDFPGNVRELKAMVFDSVTKAASSKLSSEYFSELIDRERDSFPFQGASSASQNLVGVNGVTFDRFPTLKHAETELIRRALEIAKNNQGVAARLLGITRQALNNRLQRLKKGSAA
ncbi:sigma-54-dependent Fis family transcriptional regulator [Oryzomonas sagensis]|uniref:Sigma-54-dependent Fis family transcriptional regulator n=1 Tax=Oryzomonas sagensis TaxID=2603857 RepID=A0ABQ6TPS1_9BACT|nr:sigma-54 dependent transcriptional regulator [Oryzomonas sagensis]KAB0671028.1 sigma-54-dependent Fis family transcriptional regulator [Oryzomonas sagensis]